ncbi:MAG: hypothetical protein E7436_07735 [Ruminococcaceae bacterium]|nr:hypothetical protein [Oscillospiraceae bacterium]
MKKKKLLRNILLGVLIAILAVLLIVQVAVTVRYWDFYKNSKINFMVPGLFDDFVPQGFEYIENLDAYLVSGYMTDGSASRVYVRDAKGDTIYGTLYNKDGTPYTGHAGGICTNGLYAYFPGDNGIDVFSLYDIVMGSAKCMGTIEIGYRVDFCSYVNDYLLVGNFRYEGHYATPEYQHITTPAGDENTALITVYKVSDKAVFNIEPTPVASFSIREKVQGVCVTDDDKIILSTSWGTSDSVLYVYDLDTTRSGLIATVSGTTPLYYLDSANLVKTIVAPPMAEELVYRDGRVLIMNESSSNKYIFGRFIRGSWVYGYDLSAE